MAKLYNNIKINTTNRSLSYYANAVYPEIEHSSEDKYIITGWFGYN